MSLKFTQEDGRGNAYDENRNEPAEMEVDSEQFPLEEKIKEIKAKAVVDKSPNKRDDTKRSSEKKNNFSKLIYQKGYIVPQVAEELEISRRTAYDCSHSSSETQPHEVQGNPSGVTTTTAAVTTEHGDSEEQEPSEESEERSRGKVHAVFSLLNT
ncbi:hypothetical protein G6F46_000237 [Rhizopus delemar]|uniref:Uncharacterized protein n=2 Tax=Rhizopus TaxID=4842 RepID=A0A9P7CU80_9FUNG|nr:hypothetical protein G6F36_014466 [Rhizopus arrhizus]KAG1466954.1 hypothetical protein G6F55_000156 [Rhizopus delemar]KAG1503130.1 hypothetical protein G6F54_001890 [Rhizopus delemar]KAG1518815.1 hypothetical protein G6F53_000286 [Rhizopus delemar]KAG1528697.1 hypothetical protein G6F52_000419 [Rhizopus delemar]